MTEPQILEKLLRLRKAALALFDCDNDPTIILSHANGVVRQIDDLCEAVGGVKWYQGENAIKLSQNNVVIPIDPNTGECV